MAGFLVSVSFGSRICPNCVACSYFLVPYIYLYFVAWGEVGLAVSIVAQQQGAAFPSLTVCRGLAAKRGKENPMIVCRDGPLTWRVVKEFWTFRSTLSGVGLIAPVLRFCGYITVWVFLRHPTNHGFMNYFPRSISLCIKSCKNWTYFCIVPCLFQTYVSVRKPQEPELNSAFFPLSCFLVFPVACP